jgi:hypothetical protein
MGNEGPDCRESESQTDLDSSTKVNCSSGGAEVNGWVDVPVLAGKELEQVGIMRCGLGGMVAV